MWDQTVGTPPGRLGRSINGWEMNLENCAIGIILSWLCKSTEELPSVAIDWVRGRSSVNIQMAWCTVRLTWPWGISEGNPRESVTHSRRELWKAVHGNMAPGSYEGDYETLFQCHINLWKGSRPQCTWAGCVFLYGRHVGRCWTLTTSSCGRRNWHLRSSLYYSAANKAHDCCMVCMTGPGT